MSRYMNFMGQGILINKYIVTLHVKSLICILYQMIDCHDQLLVQIILVKSLNPFQLLNTWYTRLNTKCLFD